MDGKANKPIKVTTAPTIPVAVAKIAQVTNVATAKAPGNLAKAKCKLLNNFSIKLARSTK